MLEWLQTVNSRFVNSRLDSYNIPILWKTISKGFFKAFISTLFTLVAILLTTKIEEVAKFIAIGANWYKIILFIGFQIPYIIQIALPIAAIWAAYTYFSHLNSECQIIALRSLGFSIKEILFPLGACGAFLGLGMFFFIFDFGAECHLTAKKLEFDVRLSEPLALIHTSQHLKESEVAFDLKGSLKRGSNARDLFVCLNRESGGLTFVLADKVNYHDQIIDAHQVTIVTATPVEENFSDLMIENAKLVQTPSEHMYELTGAKKWKISEDHLPLRVLVSRTYNIEKEIEEAESLWKSTKALKNKRERAYSEIARRASLSFACLTLTLLGAASAITLGRKKQYSSALQSVCYTALFIIFYLGAKSVSDIAYLAVPLFITPHIILWLLLRRRIGSLESGTA